MAIRNIVKEGDDILTKKCRTVEKFDSRLAVLLDDMAETLHLAKGAGLAAPQVGILKRAVVIDIGEGVIELVNPKIIAYSGNQESVEGCLSCPGDWGITRRPDYVRVKAQDRNGKEFVIDGRDLLAKAFCHELDHLDGIIFKQKVIRFLTPDEIEKLG
ncbi:MAG: peptide deformylase [Clostridiales bacterium]|nr:peptide deformylase [Clostridiales bacterium]